MKKNTTKYLSKNIYYAAVITSLLVVSCSDVKDLQSIYQNDNYPESITKNFKIIYTDSAKIRLLMRSKTHEDFSNKNFPHNSFPDGLTIEIFDAKKNKTIIFSDKAKIYQESNIVELEGHVEIITYDGRILKTNKLYWDRSSNWIFTEEKFSFTNPKDGTILSGIGIDFSKSFQEIVAHKTTGVVSIKKEK